MDAEGCIRRLNEAWPRGDWDVVGGCFHPDVVMLLPDSDDVMQGRDAMLDSYREFFDIATLNALTIEEIIVYDYGATVVCHMRFTIDYTIDDEREDASGIEVYTLAADDDGQAQVVWRTQLLFGDSPVVTVE
jgi:ketosteroid isomerase-like protein